MDPTGVDILVFSILGKNIIWHRLIKLSICIYYWAVWNEGYSFLGKAIRAADIRDWRRMCGPVDGPFKQLTVPSPEYWQVWWVQAGVVFCSCLTDPVLFPWYESEWAFVFCISRWHVNLLLHFPSASTCHTQPLNLPLIFSFCKYMSYAAYNLLEQNSPLCNLISIKVINNVYLVQCCSKEAIYYVYRSLKYTIYGEQTQVDMNLVSAQSWLNCKSSDWCTVALRNIVFILRQCSTFWSWGQKETGMVFGSGVQESSPPPIGRSMCLCETGIHFTCLWSIQM